MKIILTRHGETVQNAKRICVGHSSAELSKKGLEQGRRLAERMKNEKIDVIYSSDLGRSVDTANMVHKHHPEIPIHYLEEIRERDFGKYTGKSYDEFDANRQEHEFENHKKLIKRAKKFIDKIYAEYKDETIFISSHLTFQRALMAAIMGLDDKEMAKLDQIINTSITIFEIDEDKNNNIILLNCTKHLS